MFIIPACNILIILASKTINFIISHQSLQLFYFTYFTLQFFLVAEVLEFVGHRLVVHSDGRNQIAIRFNRDLNRNEDSIQTLRDSVQSTMRFDTD